MDNLICAIAWPGLRCLGHVFEQFMIVLQRYTLNASSRNSRRSFVLASRESASQRYDCSSTAGPRYLSEFHQYEGHDVVQHAQSTHSYRPSSFARSSLVW